MAMAGSFSSSGLNRLIQVFVISIKTLIFKGGMNHQDFFKLLQDEIMVDIFTRLPIRSILLCKCVCKSWLSLLESDNFVNYHFSRVARGLVVETSDDPCKIYEFADWNINNPLELKLHSLLGDGYRIEGSVDGMLLCVNGEHDQIIHVVNPITREYIKIDCSPMIKSITGFGKSRKSGQYKVIRISRNYLKLDICEVYILETRSWRRINIPAHVQNLKYIDHSFGAFVNGNLHWIANDLNNRVWISLFDLEYEQFSIFTSPLPPRRIGKERILSLTALDDCLWLCDESRWYEFVLWRLKDYGDEKSWSKDFVAIRKHITCSHFPCSFVSVKVSEDGDTVMVSTSYSMFQYSRKVDDVVKVCTNYRKLIMCLHVHTSSFLSLKRFANETILSF